MKPGNVLLALLGVHLLLGIARLPDKVFGRRIANVADYRQRGAARYLIESAQLKGADVIDWLLQNTDEHTAILWRWPADGALEFVSALIAPRLLVDERDVHDLRTHLGREVARGTPPGGTTGVLVVQGTEDGGLRLLTR